MLQRRGSQRSFHCQTQERLFLLHRQHAFKIKRWNYQATLHWRNYTSIMLPCPGFDKQKTVLITSMPSFCLQVCCTGWSLSWAGHIFAENTSGSPFKKAFYILLNVLFFPIYCAQSLKLARTEYFQQKGNLHVTVWVEMAARDGSWATRTTINFIFKIRLV